jgi:hypothetical protein
MGLLTKHPERWWGITELKSSLMATDWRVTVALAVHAITCTPQRRIHT